MSDPSIGILVISHGSPRAEANQGFVDLVGRIAARLKMENVLPAFFSLLRPDIPDQVGELLSRGVRRVLLMPYFLYSGKHITVDIPAIIAQCREKYPQLTIEMLPTLENDPAMENLVVQRLAPYVEVNPPEERR
jgi:sirohydrochlorin cobaltochelatase